MRSTVKQERTLKKAQKKLNDIRAGDAVLIWNNKRNDRKGWKLSFKWLGSYNVSDMTRKGLVTLENQNGNVLKKTYNRALLKCYIASDNAHNHDETTCESEEEIITENSNTATNEEKPAECIQKNPLVNNQKPPEARNY